MTGGFTAGDDTLSSVIVESDDSLLVGATLDTANDASVHGGPDPLSSPTAASISASAPAACSICRRLPAGFGDMVQQPDGKLLFLVGGGYNGGDYGTRRSRPPRRGLQP